MEQHSPSVRRELPSTDPASANLSETAPTEDGEQPSVSQVSNSNTASIVRTGTTISSSPATDGKKAGSVAQAGPRRASINIFGSKSKGEAAGSSFRPDESIAEEDSRRPPRIRSQTDETDKVRVGRRKEEAAMAKWRTWVNDQPDVAVMDTAGPSRVSKPRQASHPKDNIPLVPLNGSPSTIQSPRSHGLFSARRSSSHIETHDQASPVPGVGTPPRTVATSRRSSYGDGDVYYNSDTARVLQDVELAVDATVLAAARKRRAEPVVRRLSSRPRVSPVENPFIDIVPRMGSRRVRPIVLELLHALGWWIDAVWSISQPTQPCPWGHASAPNEDLLWTSPILIAIQDARSTGQITEKPTIADADFWQEELHHSILDVDEVVGIVKGLGWAFSTAMSKGDYRIEPDNIILPNGSPGDVPRLLNDLEEVIWGDAPPRSTDLAYELPEDFDIYAAPDLADIVKSSVIPISHGPVSSNPLVAFFADSSPGPQFQSPASMMTPNMPYVPTSAVIMHSPDLPPLNGATTFPAVIDTGNLATLKGLGIDPDTLQDGMTLEDIGRQRHRDWLKSRSSLVAY